MTTAPDTAFVGAEEGVGELLLTIDPGGSTTGWSLWELPVRQRIQRLDYGMVKGGLPGFIDWMIDHHRYLSETIVVCEKFIAERGAEDLTPLQIEGALICTQRTIAAPEIVWQLRSRKRNLGTTKVRDGLLKEHGLWLPGNDPKVDWKDARDVNDAALHALIYAKDWGHEPTLRAFWPPS